MVFPYGFAKPVLVEHQETRNRDMETEDASVKADTMSEFSTPR